MIRFTGRRMAAIAMACLAMAEHEVSAQLARGAGAVPSMTPANPQTAPILNANPYTNPYLNPFMNPYMAQFPTTSSNAALFFLAAQQANGGLGSGQLSGVRPSRTAVPAPVPRPAPRAEDDHDAPVPGGAARYFNRVYQTGSEYGRYYNRQGTYYRKNVH